MTFDLGVPELGRRACVLVVMVMMMLKVVMLMLEMVMMIFDNGDNFVLKQGGALGPWQEGVRRDTLAR